MYGLKLLNSKKEIRENAVNVKVEQVKYYTNLSTGTSLEDQHFTEMYRFGNYSIGLGKPELREELEYRSRLLAKMESEGSREKNRLEKLHKEADSLYKRLTLILPEYAQQKKNLTITWDQVQQNLEKGEAAIEFVRFYNEDDSLYYYNALVLKKGDKNPTLVKLCKEKDLQSILPKKGVMDLS